MKSTTTNVIPRILVLENQRKWRKIIKREFEGMPVLVQFAGSVEGAKKAVLDFVDILFVSDCAGGSNSKVGNNVLEFIHEAREFYPNLQIVATTSNCNYGQEMIEAGCDCQVCKSHVAEKTYDLLKISIET